MSKFCLQQVFVEKTMGGVVWDAWLDAALQSLEEAQLLRSLRPLLLPDADREVVSSELPTYDAQGPWDRAGVAVQVSQATVDAWLRGSTSTGE